ncbi:MAG TPA: hypothetical protein VKA02_04410 [Candidatus Acidoferrum sp.]|nr:hypothetical protein [Candidatus Acidoferrum sp.]
MNHGDETAVRILRRDAAILMQAKDKEYAYWQSRPPLERLVAMQELSFAFFGGRDKEAAIRQQFLRFAACLPVPWR